MITPLEFLKCQQQMVEDKFVTMKSITKNVIREKGIFGIYRGYAATLNRDLFAVGLYFWFFFSTKDWLEANNLMNPFNIMITGGIAGKFKL